MKVIINPIGGLANRMRAIASGISLCKELSITPEIIWPLNNDLNCRFEKLFTIKEHLFYVRNINKISDLIFYDEPRKKNLFLSPLFRKIKNPSLYITDKEISRQYSDTNKSILEDIRSAGGCIILRSGLEFYDFEHSLYKDVFRPRPEIQDISDCILEGIDTNKLIGLHVRRTDNIVSIKKSPIELFKEAIKSEIDIDNGMMFYLATDSEEVKQELKKEFGERIITFPNEATRKTQSGIIEAYAEMINLSRCIKIYGSYWSSFSEAASMIDNSPLIKLVKADN